MVTSCKLRPTPRDTIDLVHVIWDTHQGVVSLKQNKWLVYVLSNEYAGHHSRLPTISIKDEDFALSMKPLPGQTGWIATWDDVPTLLNHKDFPIHLVDFHEEVPAETV